MADASHILASAACAAEGEPRLAIVGDRRGRTLRLSPLQIGDDLCRTPSIDVAVRGATRRRIQRSEADSPWLSFVVSQPRNGVPSVCIIALACVTQRLMHRNPKASGRLKLQGGSSPGRVSRSCEDPVPETDKIWSLERMQPELQGLDSGTAGSEDARRASASAQDQPRQHSSTSAVRCVSSTAQRPSFVSAQPEKL